MSVVDQLAPDALISHAWRLVGDEPLGTPAHALDLRRAVSSAYYAVFHEVCLRTAGQVTGRGLFPAAKPDLVIAHVIRAISHRAVSSACRQIDTLRDELPDDGGQKSGSSLGISFTSSLPVRRRIASAPSRSYCAGRAPCGRPPTTTASP